jgi:2-dehydro-3-deoxygluconokinase
MRPKLMKSESTAQNAVVGYGEVLLRLRSPGFERLLQTPHLDVCVGGAEMNVLASLARFGHPTRLLTTLPDHALGEAALTEIRAHGIDAGAILRRSGRMGLYFLEAGHGLRPGEIIYDRAGSAFALDDSARSWPDLLSNAGLLHLTGITPALSTHAAANNLLAAQHARRLGLKVSVDVNFRAQLWAAAPHSREALLLPLLREAHMVFASSGDLAVSLGLPLNSAPEAPIEEHARGSAVVLAPFERLSAIAFEQFERLSSVAFERLPNIDVICTCLRVGEFADQARLVAFGRTRHQSHRSTAREIPSMVDRIGSGDAFAAGILHQWLRGQSIGPALEFGLAAAALKHSVPGDVNRVTEAEVTACMDRASAAFIRR